MNPLKKRIAIFASGSGSNAENIFHYFKGNNSIEIVSFYCNNPKAGVIERANRLGLPCHLFVKEEFIETKKIVELLQAEQINYIVLAGFLLKVPENIIKAFSNRIVNIHPALLPNYGGKGMYGMKVHKAVVAANEKKSGITIHKVNENYDEGAILFQAECIIEEQDTPEIVAAKVGELEYQHFPRIIEQQLQLIK